FQPIQVDLATCPPAGSVSGEWTGTFDSNDPVDCGDGFLAQASFRQDGEVVAGTVTAFGTCGFTDVVFQGALRGTALTGALTGGRTATGTTYPDGTAIGMLSGGNLELTIESASGGRYYFASGKMHLHR